MKNDEIKKNSKQINWKNSYQIQSNSQNLMLQIHHKLNIIHDMKSIWYFHA